MYRQIRGQGSDLDFRIDPKNTRVVEDLDFLLPIEFRSAVSEENFRENENMKIHDGWTREGQQVITIMQLSLPLRCTKT